MPTASAVSGILPVPGWLFLVGGATVLIVSFVALGALWKTPKLEVGSGRPLPDGLQRFLLSPYTRIVASGLSLALFIVIWSAAAFGSDRASANLAPTFIYVIFWVGMVLISIVLGNVWSVLDPWRAAADLVAWFGQKLGLVAGAAPVSEQLGLWPGAVLLLAFTVLELVYSDPANPRVLAKAILVYSVATWSGMLVYGRGAWRANGDGFAVYFGFISRAALFGSRERRRSHGAHPSQAAVRARTCRAPPRRRGVLRGDARLGGVRRSLPLELVVRKIYDVETRFSDPVKAERAVMAFNLSGSDPHGAVRRHRLHALGEGRGRRRRSARGVLRGLRRQPHPDRDRLRPLPLPLVAPSPGQFVIPLLSDPYGIGVGTSSAPPASSRTSRS